MLQRTQHTDRPARGGGARGEAVAALLAGLPPTHWTSSELRLLNRPSAPVLLLLWRHILR
jgi:hypothetical protein